MEGIQDGILEKEMATPSSIFLLGKSCGLGSLASCSLWGHREWEAAEFTQAGWNMQGPLEQQGVRFTSRRNIRVLIGDNAENTALDECRQGLSLTCLPNSLPFSGICSSALIEEILGVGFPTPSWFIKQDPNSWPQLISLRVSIWLKGLATSLPEEFRMRIKKEWEHLTWKCFVTWKLSAFRSHFPTWEPEMLRMVVGRKRTTK